MASRKTQRIQVGGKTGSMSQKRKISPAERIIIDDDTDNATLHSEPISKQNTEVDTSKKKAKAGKNNKNQGREMCIGDQGRLKNKNKNKKDMTLRATDKEPKKKTGKNSSVPVKWFINHTTRGMWLDGYTSKPISFCSMICTKLIEDMPLKCMEKLKKSSIWKLINPGSIGYPRLTRLFYLNLQQIEGNSMILSSRVAGQDIILDHSVFSKVLGGPAKYKTDNHPDRKEGVKLAKTEFLLSNLTPPSSSKLIKRSMLGVESMIVFTILMRCVVPKENLKELVISDKILYIMHLIMHDYEVDMPEMVMEHMLYASTQHILPYANLLPKFFKHFGISVKNEEKMSSGMEMISEMYLENELFEDEDVEEIFSEEDDPEEEIDKAVFTQGIPAEELEKNQDNEKEEMDAAGTEEEEDEAETEEEEDDGEDTSNDD